MTIHFQHTLCKALENINFTGEPTIISIYPPLQARTDEILVEYGKAKWAVVDKLNERYSAILNKEFNLHHWLHYNEHDEVAYFLNEAGSNALHYSEFKTPSHFHLWMGKKGFVIGIEQQGKGFDAKKVHEEKIKEGDGAAFEFFRTCKGTIFFDEAEKARVVYLEVRV